mmetsp:Transcript_82449/g.241988  ORF Transcript_82449/g.241988 Transcript_82449/m.241988 type:complete len:302 (-) Transcript_82449:47-952(-)
MASGRAALFQGIAAFPMAAPAASAAPRRRAPLLSGALLAALLLAFPDRPAVAWALARLPPRTAGLGRGHLLQRAAKGFATEDAASAASQSSGFGSPVHPDRSDVFTTPEDVPEQPFAQLGGPLKPPAAPATYKSLTKIRLRVAASRVADIVTSTEIRQGAIFRAVEAKEDDDGVLFLRTDGEYENGWFMEKGIVGPFAGKSVVKRVAGSAKKGKGPALLSMSEVSRSEVMGMGKPEDKAKREAAAEVPTPQSRKQSVVSMIEDPEVRKVLEQSGISVEDLKRDPEFLQAVARRLFGEEVVG